MRRSRGYAPLPVRLPFDAPPPLAVGGELKNAFCLASGRDAWMSQHIGDMGSLETLAAFERSIAAVRASSTRSSPSTSRPTCTPATRPGGGRRRPPRRRSSSVQHHHAHIAAVMAEHGVRSMARVIGLAFDGTGYGTDGAIWGGEILVAGYAGFERAAHLADVPLPGGDAAIRKPYRAALAHLWAAGIEWDEDLAPVGRHRGRELAVVARQLERGIGARRRLEHGAPVRRGELVVRVAPGRHLRGPGGHGARGRPRTRPAARAAGRTASAGGGRAHRPSPVAAGRRGGPARRRGPRERSPPASTPPSPVSSARLGGHRRAAPGSTRSRSAAGCSRTCSSAAWPGPSSRHGAFALAAPCGPAERRRARPRPGRGRRRHGARPGGA